MKKAFLFVLLVLTTMVLLFAGGGQEGQASSGGGGSKQNLLFVYSQGWETLLTGQGVAGSRKNILEGLSKDKNIDVQAYHTPTLTEVRDALYRLGPLPSTEEDLIWIPYGVFDDRLAAFLEPMNKYLQDKPLDAYPDDYSKGMLDFFSINGQLYALPWRAGVFNLWYNTRLFEERGIKGPPTTPEELYEVAKQLTHTKPNGEKIYGMAFRHNRGDIYETLALGARMYGGEIITSDRKIVINQEPVIKFLQLLKRLVDEGIMPSNWGQFEASRMMDEGQIAMVCESGISSRYNDPNLSKEAGNWEATFLPLSKELQTPDKSFSDSISFAWAIGILKGSQRKDAAWEAIRYMSQEDNVWEIAVNGNQPARISLMERFSERVPSAKITAEVLKYTRTALPPLRNTTRIIDIIAEHVENVVLRGRDAQNEMDLAAKEIEPLM
ncbi:extracellular solute-binding protein [Treponema sp. OttesenSCG-928-L16]|nr:extracellular solute-binding protein [Treponema sp. OttesenSCG-928-L16]